MRILHIAECAGAWSGICPAFADVEKARIGEVVDEYRLASDGYFPNNYEYRLTEKENVTFRRVPARLCCLHSEKERRAA